MANSELVKFQLQPLKEGMNRRKQGCLKKVVYVNLESLERLALKRRLYNSTNPMKDLKKAVVKIVA